MNIGHLRIIKGDITMDWDKFKVRFPDAYEALELLAQLQPESAPQEINSGLRGAIKGSLVEVLGQDDGRYFLKALWGIEGGSTLNLSQTQGSILGMWLRGFDNEKRLPSIVDALRVFEGAQASEAISAERKVEAETEMQQVAREIGAEIKVLDEEKPGDRERHVLKAIAHSLERADTSAADALRLDALPEAPASFNFFASIKGFNGQFTLRGWDEGRLLLRAYALISSLEELGVFPTDRYGNQITTVNNASTIAEAKQSTTTTAPPAQRQQQPRQQPQTTTTADGHEKFLVKEIEAQIVGTDNDKFVARGGRYMKFGVPVWHEVADQIHGLFDDVHLDDLKTRESWSAAGRNLFALAEKPEGEKFAQKVIEFVVG